MSGGIEFCFFAGAACLVRKEFPIGVKEQSPLTGFTTATMAKIIDSGLPVLRRSQSMLEYIILTALMVIMFVAAGSKFNDLIKQKLWNHFRTSKYFITNTMDVPKYNADPNKKL
jgi:hypothetical protein